MKKISIILSLCLLTVLISGCGVDLFRWPTGVWISDELGISMHFEEAGGKGTILSDGISSEVVGIRGVAGRLAIVSYPIETRYGERIPIFSGTLRHRIGNRMDYTIRVKDGYELETPVTYRFVRARE
jgi:hypothetical protein